MGRSRRRPRRVDAGGWPGGCGAGELHLRSRVWPRNRRGLRDGLRRQQPGRWRAGQPRRDRGREGAEHPQLPQAHRHQEGRDRRWTEFRARVQRQRRLGDCHLHAHRQQHFHLAWLGQPADQGGGRCQGLLLLDGHRFPDPGGRPDRRQHRRGPQYRRQPGLSVRRRQWIFQRAFPGHREWRVDGRRQFHLQRRVVVGSGRLGPEFAAHCQSGAHSDGRHHLGHRGPGRRASRGGRWRTCQPDGWRGCGRQRPEQRHGRQFGRHENGHQGRHHLSGHRRDIGQQFHIRCHRRAWPLRQSEHRR